MEPKQPRRKKIEEGITNAIEKAEKTALQKNQERLKHLIHCVNAVAGSEEGRFFFREFARYCAFGCSKVGFDQITKVVHNESTDHNAAREAVYLHFRDMIRRKYLIDIELSTAEE